MISMSTASPVFLVGDSPSINLLVKLPGTKCNLSCDYCFEHKKGISEIPGQFVSAELIKRTICDSDIPVNLVFHGGEPLLASPSFFSSLLCSLRPIKNKIKAVQIQTNGTLLTQQFIDLFWGEFSDFSIEISISLDGDARMNVFRKTHETETFSKVMATFRLLDQNGISAGLLSVIHRNTLPLFKEYIDFISSIPNVRFVKLNPLHLVSSRGDLLHHSIAPSEFALFVMNVFKRYIDLKLYERFPMEPCLSIMQTLSGVDTHYCNYSNRKCSNFICLYPHGSLSLCDSLPFAEFSFSRLQERKTKLYPIMPLLNECSRYSINNFCKGGCLGIRYMLKKSSSLLNDYCESKRILFEFFSHFIKEVQQ